jgi:hypothetical protein
LLGLIDRFEVGSGHSTHCPNAVAAVASRVPGKQDKSAYPAFRRNGYAISDLFQMKQKEWTYGIVRTYLS